MNETTQSYTDRALGEVVEASTSDFGTQCHRLYDAPALGTLVKSEGDSPIYGIVGEVTTQSIDPGRRTMAMGEDDDSGDAVYRRNPQLARLLTTEFRSIVVGHRENGTLRRYLAPLPPRIHSVGGATGATRGRGRGGRMSERELLAISTRLAEDIRGTNGYVHGGRMSGWT